MCELIVSNLHDTLLNQIAVYYLGFDESRKHPDGFGLFCNGNWNKTGLQLCSITNAGKVLLSLVNDSICLAHIRQASKGTAVSDANAHPFVGSDGKLVLFHNGTLKLKNSHSDIEKRLEGAEVDSAKFLLVLEEELRSSGDFLDSLKKAYEKFDGPFAFLIVNDDKVYIVRGRSKTLYISYAEADKKRKKRIGYIINTDKHNIEMGSVFIQNISQIVERPIIFSEPEELAKDTIYLAENDGITKVGELVETDIPVEKVVSSSYRVYDEGTEISNLMLNLHLSPLDVDIISYSLYGKHIVELDYSAAIDLLGHMKSIKVNEKVRSLIESLFGERPVPFDLYKNTEMRYPWYINDYETIERALKSAEDEK